MCCRYTPLPLSFRPFSSTNPSTNPLQAGPQKARDGTFLGGSCQDPGWQLQVRSHLRYLSVQPLTKHIIIPNSWITNSANAKLWEEESTVFSEKEARLRSFCSSPGPSGIQTAAAPH